MSDAAASVPAVLGAVVVSVLAQCAERQRGELERVEFRRDVEQLKRART